MKSNCIYGSDDCTFCTNDELPCVHKKNLPSYNVYMVQEKTLETILDGLNAEKLKIWDSLPNTDDIPIRGAMERRLKEIDDLIIKLFTRNI